MIFPSPATRAMICSEAPHWAQRTGGYILDDDYDGELRYDRQPVGALQGLCPDRVVYLGSASKSLSPALRLGWMALPGDLVEPVIAAAGGSQFYVDAISQLTMADFIASGEFERHIRRSRALYAERRAALLAALSAELGDRVEVLGAEAGLHVALRIKSKLTAPIRELVAHAAESGVGLYPADGYYARPPRAPTLVLGYSSLPPADLREGVDAFSNKRPAAFKGEW